MDVNHIELNLNTDSEENAQHQEGIIHDIYERPGKDKKSAFDKMLKIIQRKVLKGIHLPVTLKEIQAGYLVNPYFKDVYLYLV